MNKLNRKKLYLLLSGVLLVCAGMSMGIMVALSDNPVSQAATITPNGRQPSVQTPTQIPTPEATQSPSKAPTLQEPTSQPSSQPQVSEETTTPAPEQEFTPCK